MWKSKKYYIFQVCVCSLSYPTCNMHVPFLHCHLGPVRLYHNFLHCLVWHKFKKKVIEHKMCVLIISATFV